jgi:hypothetical protein
MLTSTESEQKHFNASVKAGACRPGRMYHYFGFTPKILLMLYCEKILGDSEVRHEVIMTPFGFVAYC